ncbi:MAG TPA: GNAT family N-acetyltransferase [Dermatophilaceae bacterium]|nr:GNAT family N-acetyltransferase [Dermatophilaceae bacterium]
MLGTHASSGTVRALTPADHDAALAVCAQDPRSNVFVAARILDGTLVSQPGALLGVGDGPGIQALCWASANVVPVECDAAAAAAFAAKLRPWRRRSCSLFGPATTVLPMWQELRVPWGKPRAIRERQPLLALSSIDPGLPRDERVRPARRSEVDLVLPAAAAMFTEEIGYPPYVGSSAGYRNSVAGLVAKGHTFVRVDGDEVVFKADVGSTALGVAQIQGVWLAPRLRGRGLAAPAMASVVDQVRATIAPTVSLYVNDFNVTARRTYARVGFCAVGTFATILL